MMIYDDYDDGDDDDDDDDDDDRISFIRCWSNSLRLGVSSGRPSVADRCQIGVR